MKPVDFPTPWKVITRGKIAAEFATEASARLYVSRRRLDAQIEDQAHDRSTD